MLIKREAQYFAFIYYFCLLMLTKKLESPLRFVLVFLYNKNMIFFPKNFGVCFLNRRKLEITELNFPCVVLSWDNIKANLAFIFFINFSSISTFCFNKFYIILGWFRSHIMLTIFLFVNRKRWACYTLFCLLFIRSFFINKKSRKHDAYYLNGIRLFLIYEDHC